MKIPENYLVPHNWPVLLFFGVAGLVLFVVGCVMGLQRYALYRDAVPAQGRVVEMERHEDRSKDREGRWTTSVSYHPVIEFAAAGGAKHRFTGGPDLTDYGVGATVSVLYEPGNPANARIASFMQFWGAPLYYGLSGFLVLAFSIGGYFFLVHRESSEIASMAEIRKERENEVRLHRENELRRIMTEWNLLKGVVESVRKQQHASGEEYVVVCRATLPDGISQERFEADPIVFHPGPGILGKSVEIYVDPGDKTRYEVMLEPVLAELQSAKP